MKFTRMFGLTAAMLGSVGCVSLERVVKNPAQPELTTVEAYNTSLHRQSVHLFNPISLDNRVAQLHLEPRVDNLFFLLDQSQALSTEYRGVDTQFYAREMVRRFSKTMPKKGYRGAVILFEEKAPTTQLTELRLTEYTAAGLQQALVNTDQMQRIEGESLAFAVDHLAELISRTPGTSAVVLVTSWSQINTSVEQAVMRMRQRSEFPSGVKIMDTGPETVGWGGHQFGVCFYTVGVGNQLSRSRLESVDNCGYSVAANKVAQPRDMAHFVQTVLYKGPADSDGDGIYDFLDRCPNTAPGRIVDYAGCLRFAAGPEVISND
ncbi:MAG: VWA domain-containing protein [Pseudomonadota bacterium]